MKLFSHAKAVRNVAIAFLTALITFIILDLLWVGWIAQDFYQDNIGVLLADQVRWGAAGVFYLFYATGVLIFCVMPSPVDRRWFEAFGRGAALGAFGYGTYNLTNLATLRDWTTKMVVVDIAWGIAATAMVATISFLVWRRCVQNS